MIWERLKCEQCGREFSSEDPNAFTCQRCDRVQREAQEQTKEMPPPALEDRPWSKSWKRERLGVNTDRDE